MACFPHTLGNDFMHFPIIKCCEKNKMDNAKISYCSVEITGKIKKISFLNPNQGGIFGPSIGCVGGWKVPTEVFELFLPHFHIQINQT